MMYNCTIRDVFLLILALDIGNSSVAFGVYDAQGEGELLLTSKLSAVTTRQCDEYAVMLSGILAMNNIKLSDIDGVIMSSVVPPLTGVIESAVRRLTNLTPMIVGPGIKTGLNIKIDHHTQLGSDIVANVTAALTTAKPPFVVIDIGSATTFTVVNAKSELCGVIIAPGVRKALDALSDSAAELPYISLEKPKQFLAKNTIDSMKCGAIYGSAFMIEGFIERIRSELGIAPDEPFDVTATGGLAGCIIPYCSEKYNIKNIPTLTLDGLYRLYQKNRTQQSSRNTI